jgi:hypothetical protein
MLGKPDQPTSAAAARACNNSDSCGSVPFLKTVMKDYYPEVDCTYPKDLPIDLEACLTAFFLPPPLSCFPQSTFVTAMDARSSCHSQST